LLKLREDEIHPQYGKNQGLAHFSRGFRCDARWSAFRGRMALHQQADFAPRRSYSAERRPQEAVADYGCPD